MAETEELARQLAGARSGGGAFAIPPRLLLRLSGADALRYLNGQVTRDLGRLREGEAVACCLLTPKGKLCATLLVRREGEDFVLEADCFLEEILLPRLERYLVADDVVITAEPDPSGVHLFGPLAAEEPWSQLPGISVERLGVPGRDLELSVAASGILPPLLDQLVVETLRIERGIPRWGRELTGEILPPEALLDRTHIDYDRGCYPGQETISRLRSIGRVNRILRRLSAPRGSSLRSGMEVLDGRGEPLGTLSSAAMAWDTGCPVALALLPRETSESLSALDPLTGGKTPLSIAAEPTP